MASEPDPPAADAPARTREPTADAPAPTREHTADAPAPTSDAPPPAPGASASAGARSYAERLSVAWWLWAIGLLGAAVLALEIWMGGAGLRSWVPFVVLLPLCAGLLWWLGRIRVTVADGLLVVDDARLPVRFIADVVPLDADGRRELLGVAAHPLAFVIQRPWIRGAVQVVLNDPADPTPYWLVSTRRPVDLARALLAARDAAAR